MPSFAPHDRATDVDDPLPRRHPGPNFRSQEDRRRGGPLQGGQGSHQVQRCVSHPARRCVVFRARLLLGFTRDATDGAARCHARAPTTPPRSPRARGIHRGYRRERSRARSASRTLARRLHGAVSARARRSGFSREAVGGEMARGPGTPLSARHRRPRARPTLPTRDRDRLGRHSTRVTLTRSPSLALSQARPLSSCSPRRSSSRRWSPSCSSAASASPTSTSASA